MPNPTTTPGLTEAERRELATALEYDDVASKPIRLDRGVWVTAVEAVVPVVERIVAARVAAAVADVEARVLAVLDDPDFDRRQHATHVASKVRTALSSPTPTPQDPA